VKGPARDGEPVQMDSVPCGTPHCFQDFGDTPTLVAGDRHSSGVERYLEAFAKLLPGRQEWYRPLGSA
jgi:hypothetical protein